MQVGFNRTSTNVIVFSASPVATVETEWNLGRKMAQSKDSIMNKREWFSALIGLLLLGSAVALIRGRKAMPITAQPSDDAPVERLADELKEAWSEHHTQA